MNAQDAILEDVRRTALLRVRDVRMPAKLTEALQDLMETAEKQFPAKGGTKKKAWVIRATKELAREIDIPGIPDQIEDPLLDVIVHLAVEVIWGALFSGGKR